jgi:uncharacterized protein
MGRVLFWFLVGLAAYALWRWWDVRRRLPDRGDGGAAARDRRGEAMVRCESCGLNVPQSEALADGPRWYCSEEHRRRGPA